MCYLGLYHCKSILYVPDNCVFWNVHTISDNHVKNCICWSFTRPLRVWMKHPILICFSLKESTLRKMYFLLSLYTSHKHPMNIAGSHDVHDAPQRLYNWLSLVVSRPVVWTVWSNRKIVIFRRRCNWTCYVFEDVIYLRPYIIMKMFVLDFGC